MVGHKRDVGEGSSKVAGLETRSVTSGIEMQDRVGTVNTLPDQTSAASNRGVTNEPFGPTEIVGAGLGHCGAQQHRRGSCV